MPEVIDVSVIITTPRASETLEKIEEIRRPAVMAVAAIVGPVRLIDNMVIRVKKKKLLTISK